MKAFKYIVRITIAFALTGIVLSSCKKDEKGGNPQATNISPGIGSAGDVVTLTGSGLSGIKSIVFEKDSVPALFNPNFNTNEAFLFRIPDTASGGKQNIIFKTIAGATFSMPFEVVALPNVTKVSINDFAAGDEITLSGINFEAVNKVVLTGTTDEAIIVSKSKKELVIKMPSSSVGRAKLDISNESGKSTTTQEFVNMNSPVNFLYFGDDFEATVQNWGWGASFSTSTQEKKSGSSSIKAVFSKGGWGALSLNKGDPSLNTANYTYATFWVKGGTSDVKFTVGSFSGGTTKVITAPAGVWTYFKLPISEFIGNLTLGGVFYLQINGPDDAEQTIYFDNIMFVK